MTTDIKIRWDTNLMEGDFIFENNDLVTDEGLATAVLISLFTDQRASDEDDIPNANVNQNYIDKRGWWGDVVSPVVDGDEIGSKLWLLERAKTTDENLAAAEEYATDALEWMKDDEIAKAITVTAERQQINGQEVLALAVEIERFDGNKLNLQFDPEWFNTLSED